MGVPIQMIIMVTTKKVSLILIRQHARGCVVPLLRRLNRLNIDRLTIAARAYHKISHAGDESRKVTGICYETNKPHQAMLNEGGEVILSAGAIGSPQILELSGIGRGDILQAEY